MASIFKKHAESAWKHQFDIFGQAAVYSPKNGVPVNVTVIASEIRCQEEQMSGNVVQMKFREIKVPLDTVTNPLKDDIVVVDSENWIVAEPPDILSCVAVLNCRQDKTVIKRNEIGQRAMPGR